MAGESILIVEDEPISEQVTRSALIRLGYTVPAAAASGEEAIRMVGEMQPALVLMDIYLQGKMDGITAAEKIHQHFDIPIIYLTAESREDVAARARRSSSYGYLIKPVGEKELHSAIETALHSHRVAGELKTAQRALEEQKTFLAQVIDISPNAVFVRDRAGRYVLANQAAAHSIGCTVSELIGKSEIDFSINSQQTERLLAEDQQVMDSLKELLIPEEQIRFPDGSLRWIQTTKRPITGLDGRADHVLVTLVDISGRKVAQAAQHQQHQILNARVKELKCLYRLSRVLENPAFLNEKFFLSILEIIPTAWQFPEICGVKIIYEDREFITDNFMTTPWELASNITMFGEQIGSITVSYLEDKTQGNSTPFLNEEQTLLNEIAERVGKKIERQRIETAEREQRALAEAINDISAALNSTLNQDEVLERILAFVGRVVPNDAANIWLLGDQSQVVAVVCGAGQGEIASKIVPGLVLSEIPRYRQMIETSQGLFIAHVSDSPEWVDFPVPDWTRFKSYVGMPIYAKEHLVGILNLDSVTPGYFNETHVRKLSVFAHQAAIAIENARLFEKNNHLYQEVWEGRRRLQALSRQLLSLQEAEKKHTARELHDEIGQSLTAIKLNLQAIQYQGANPALHTQLNDSINIVDRALAQVRGLLLDLRPTLLDDLGLIAALRSHIDRYIQRGDLNIRFEAGPFPERLPTDIETICYRVVQEALTNISKHARADQVTVELCHQESWLRFSIQDDGAGFDVAAARERAAQGKSLGLISMEERVLLGEGRIEIESSPSAGTKITAWLPLPPPSMTPIEE